MADDNHGLNNDSQSSGNPNTTQNLTEEDRSKGGKVSASHGDMPKGDQTGGQAAQQSGSAHQLTKEERSEGGSHE